MAHTDTMTGAVSKSRTKTTHGCFSVLSTGSRLWRGRTSWASRHRLPEKEKSSLPHGGLPGDPEHPGSHRNKRCPGLRTMLRVGERRGKKRNILAGKLADALLWVCVPTGQLNQASLGSLWALWPFSFPRTSVCSLSGAVVLGWCFSFFFF